MLYILVGEDDFSLTRSLEEIKKDVGEQSILAGSVTTLDGQQVTSDQLRNVCETVPFLGGKRLVIIHELLKRFVPRGRPNRQKKSARLNNHTDEYKSFADCIKNTPDSTILVLVENRIASNNPLLKELAEKAVMKSFPLLRDTQLRQWIQKRVTEEGGSISLQAANLLTRLVGSNLWIIASEIDKLLLFTSGRCIEEADVKAVVGYTRQASVFAMVDAIIEFKTELAEQWLQQLLQRGAHPVYLLAMLSRQVNLIVRARELKNQGKPNAEIQRKLGLTSEFALRKTLEQASRNSTSWLKEVYHQLLEADLWIKTGKYNDELAVTILVAELSRRRETRTTPSYTR